MPMGHPAADKKLWHLAVVTLVYCAFRVQLLGHLDSPVFGWRPSDMSGIALEYYRNGFHFLSPQVLWGGAGPGYVEMEFPLAPFLTALMFKVFGPSQWVNEIVPLGCGLGIVWTTYLLGAYLLGSRAAFIAGVVVAAAPNLVMLTNTGMWADPPMVLAGNLGLYWLVVWAKSDNLRALAAGTTAVALAILLKLPALYLGIPIAYLFLQKYGASCWKQPIAWFSALGMLLPSLLWYRHANQLYQQFHNTFGILGAGYLKFGDVETLGHTTFYTSTARRVALYHLTPLGTLAFLYGLFVSWRQRQTFLSTWLGSVLLFALVAAGGVWYGHYHYLLPLLPIAALIVGLGAAELVERASRHLRDLRWVFAVQAALLVVFLANAVLAGQRFESRDHAFDILVWGQKKRTGEVLKSLTQPGDRLIVSDTQMDQVTPETSMTPPDVFYFSDRHGWYLSVAWLSPARIEELHRQGATHFVVSGNAVADFKAKRNDILGYLDRTYRRILDDENGIAFALNQPPQAAAIPAQP